jgi:hypothetical protein
VHQNPTAPLLRIELFINDMQLGAWPALLDRCVLLQAGQGESI